MKQLLIISAVFLLCVHSIKAQVFKEEFEGNSLDGQKAQEKVTMVQQSSTRAL